MVETVSDWMLFPFSSRVTARIQSAQFSVIDFDFSYGCCREAPIQKMKKNSTHKGGGNRLLISINVLGSAGPLRFLVNEGELVAAVIETAVRNYAREGRLPILGSEFNDFLLYCANAGTDAMSPWETIGSRGGRNFVLYKKSPQMSTKAGKMTDGVISRKSGGGSWKSWINKSLSFKVSPH